MTEATDNPGPAGDPSAGEPPWFARPALGCLLLAVVTLVVYWPVQRCGFLSLDDPFYVLNNAQVQGGLSGSSVLWAFGSRAGALWHPLTWLSYLVDTELFGKDPSGPHLVNLFWHVANSIFLFLAFRQMTGAHWRSLVVAALFALHPLHVESVAWISERKDVLSGFFFITTLLAYARYAQAGPANRAWLWYCLALCLFALGLMSKAMVVTLPFVLLLLDYWPLRRFAIKNQRSKIKNLLLEKLPFFALSVVACALAVWAHGEPVAMQPLPAVPVGVRLGAGLVAYARYVEKTFWPSGLAIPYPFPAAWPALDLVSAAGFLIIASALALWSAPKFPFIATGWFWFVGTLLPVTGLVQVGEQAMADRYTYLPLVGWFVLLSWGVATLFSRWEVSRAGLAAGLALLLALCAVLTRVQLGYWRNGETLFAHTLAVTKDNWLACFALGSQLAGQQHTDEAIPQFRRALELRPDSTGVMDNLANALVENNQYGEALAWFQKALARDPDLADLRSDYGAALEKSGRSADALAQYARALQLAPDSALTHYRLANTLARLGRNEEAISHYRSAIQCRPDYVSAYNNLAVALFKSGRNSEALEAFLEALRRNPDDAHTHCNLGNLLAAEQKWNEAAAQYAEAARLLPGLSDAHLGLAQVLIRLGRRDEAIAKLKEVLRLRPGFTPAKEALRALGAAVPE